MNNQDSAHFSRGIVYQRGSRPATRPTRGSPFVLQSHALGAPRATPRGLLVAVAVVVALYVIGRRLSD